MGANFQSLFKVELNVYCCHVLIHSFLSFKCTNLKVLKQFVTIKETKFLGLLKLDYNCVFCFLSLFKGTLKCGVIFEGGVYLRAAFN